MLLLDSRWVFRLIFLVIVVVLKTLADVFLNKLRKKDIEKIRKLEIIESFISMLNKALTLNAY